ncbi:MAG: CoA-transferase [Intestinimonas sp.]
MKIIPSSQVGRLIPDGASVLLTGITLCGYAEEAFLQIERSFLDCGHPRDLTLYWQASVGDMATKGLSHICHEGLLAKGVGGHINGCGKVMTEFCRDNKAAIYNWPQGVCVAMLHAIAAKTPGVVTKIGLKTFMDPRYGGGRMNAAATEDLIDLVTLRGEEWLLYKAPKKIDVTLIRGTVADERGNIAMTKEGYKLGQLAAAEAARATGGIVICQVERIVKSGTLHPRLVEVPGVLVDYVYVAQPEYHWQTAASQFNPVFAGDYKVPLESIPPVKFDISDGPPRGDGAPRRLYRQSWDRHAGVHQRRGQRRGLFRPVHTQHGGWQHRRRPHRGERFRLLLERRGHDRNGRYL